jgi:hypothetical protein
MNDLALQLAIPILSGVIVSVITAVITVHLSLRRFYSEKWWERKAEAYSRIVECLYLVQLNAQAVLTAVEASQEFPDEEYDRLSEEARKAGTEIAKATSIGAFIISEAVADALARLHSRLEQAHNEPSFHGRLD